MPYKKGILITRPLEDSLCLAKKLSRLDHACYIQPVLSVHYYESELPELSHLIFTSRYGVKAFTCLCPFRNLFVWCVGEKTALCAREAGFKYIYTAPQNNADSLYALIRSEKIQDVSFVYISGEDVTFDFSKHLSSCKRIILYDTQPSPFLRPRIKQALQNGKIHFILLYSRKTAEVLQKLIEVPQPVKIIGLSPKITALFPNHRSYVAPTEKDIIGVLVD